MKNLSSKTIGVIFAVTAFSIFAFTDTCVKMTSASYDPFAVALYMNIFVILFLLPVAWKNGDLRKIMATKSLKAHAFRSYFMMINYLCIIYAFSQLPLATIYIIIFSMPFMLNIMAIFVLKEKISLYRWMAIIAGLSGILVALYPDITSTGTPSMSLALMIAATGTFFLSCSTIANKFIDKKDHWLSYPLYLMLFQTPVIAAIVLYRGDALLPNFNDWTTMPWFIAGGIGFVAALSLMPQAIQRIDASMIGCLVYLAFPWGVLYGYFIFGDILDGWTLAGAAIIITSGLYLIHREHIEHSKILETD